MLDRENKERGFWGLYPNPQSILPSIHHYLSSLSQLHKPGMGYREDRNTYCRIIGGLITFTLGICFSCGNPGPCKTEDACLLCSLCTLPCLQSLITVIKGTCRIYYLCCVDTAVATTPSFFNSAGGSRQVACGYFLELILTALYFFRESL